ncbi:hypothetical protein ACFL5I_00435 [Planctomycetota bacterium]
MTLKRVLMLGFVGILLWIVPIYLDNAWAQESDATSDVRIEIRKIKTSAKQGRDVIEVIGSSNLPPQTILEITLTSAIVTLDTSMIREAVVTSKYVELDSQRRFDCVLSDFIRRLPAAVYTLKLSVSNRQRTKVKKTIPNKILGKTITQRKLVVGDLEGLINYIKNQHEEFKSAIKILNTVSDDLAEWVGIYNGLEKKDQFRKQYKDDFTAWQLGMAPRMNKIVEKVAAYTVGSLPYLYRVANLGVIRISGTLRNQESIFAGLISERPIVSGDPQRSEPPKTEITKGLLDKVEDIIIRDTVFSLLQIARYQAEELDLTREDLKGEKDTKVAWDKYQTKYQDLLTKLAEYTDKFKSSLDISEEKLELVNPLFSQLEEYQILVKQKAETLSALIAEPEDPEEVTILNQKLVEINNKMEESFKHLTGKLASQPSEEKPPEEPSGEELPSEE